MTDASLTHTNSKSALKLTIKQWTEQFPKAFNLNHPIPLKKGVVDELFSVCCPPLSKKHVRLAICYYTNDFKYHQAIAQSEDKKRYDLDGNPVGEILDEEDHYARKQLKKIKALHRECKDAKLNRAATSSSLDALQNKFNDTDTNV